MQYLTIAPDYTDYCIKDSLGHDVDLMEIGLSPEFVKEIESWQNNYRQLIPLSVKERENIVSQINHLDEKGLEIARTLQYLIPGGAKVKYFSEGLLRYLTV